jgi:hypothetical protein
VDQNLLNMLLICTDFTCRLNTKIYKNCLIHVVCAGNKQYTYNYVYYSSVKIFNHLPQNISKPHNNIHIFKTMLRNYLVKNAFYSIDEFLSKGCNS